MVTVNKLVFPFSFRTIVSSYLKKSRSNEEDLYMYLFYPLEQLGQFETPNGEIAQNIHTYMHACVCMYSYIQKRSAPLSQFWYLMR